MALDGSIITTFVICGIILIILVVLLVLSSRNNSNLKRVSNSLDEFLPHEENDPRWNAGRSGVSYQKENVEGEIKKVAKKEGEFSNYLASYNTHCQIVSIFPLLGILGTVVGIIFMGDISEASMSDFSLALWTTFAGLVASIIMKAKLSLCDGRSVSEFENKVDGYYRMINAIQLQEEMNKRQEV